MKQRTLLKYAQTGICTRMAREQQVVDTLAAEGKVSVLATERLQQLDADFAEISDMMYEEETGQKRGGS